MDEPEDLNESESDSENDDIQIMTPLATSEDGDSSDGDAIPLHLGMWNALLRQSDASDSDSTGDLSALDDNAYEEPQLRNLQQWILRRRPPPAEPRNEYVEPPDIDLFNYDIELPLEHSYLGELVNLQNGRIIFSEGAKVRLHLVYLNGIILVPGQEIPFTVRNPALLDFFRLIVNSESKTFGVGYDTNYGTTAEVRSFSFDEDHHVMNIRAEGRQRFVITQKTRDINEVYNAQVVILPEVNLGNFFGPIRAKEKASAPRTKELVGLTHLSELLFRQFDDSVLVSKLRAILEGIIEQRNRNEAFAYPEDPTAFSYFVLTCIPLPDKMKSRLLQLNCTTQRLRLLHALLTSPFNVQCAHCGLQLCKREDFLVMSKRGTGGTFVNPSGSVHELFTFSRIMNVQSVSEWNDQFSWFPDYGWIITRCAGCMLHLGWKFVTKKANIFPKAFWAITRTAIKISFVDIAEDNFAYKFVHDPTPMDTAHWDDRF